MYIKRPIQKDTSDIVYIGKFLEADTLSKCQRLDLNARWHSVTGVSLRFWAILQMMKCLQDDLSYANAQYADVRM